jgi:hypothetical protein
MSQHRNYTYFKVGVPPPLTWTSLLPPWLSRGRGSVWGSFRTGRRSGRFSSGARNTLHRSDSQRQAVIRDRELSEISWEREGFWL